jgi:hypothetical protein
VLLVRLPVAGEELELLVVGCFFDLH